MPAPSYIGPGSEPVIGLASAETGILVGDTSLSIDNPKVPFLDRYGGVIGKALNHDISMSMQMSGEISSADSGLNLETFTVAATIANAAAFEPEGDGTYHGVDFTGIPWFLDEVNRTQPRGQARTIEFTFIRHLGLTSA